MYCSALSLTRLSVELWQKLQFLIPEAMRRRESNRSALNFHRRSLGTRSTQSLFSWNLFSLFFFSVSFAELEGPDPDYKYLVGARVAGS